MALEGQQIGHYRLIRLVGSGGMGEVHLAEDIHIQRQVAIKVIRTEITPYPNTDTIREAARLFQREARAIAQLDHPNILPLYDYGEENRDGGVLTYLVMPFRPEGSLPGWLQKLSSTDLLSLEDVAHIIAQATAALQHAHDHQIIHQDVKPANFLVRERADNPRHPDLLLADFGIAKVSSATSGMSQTTRGTPTYMAPEQWSGNPTPASDQYSLAVMAYELLTGQAPFRGSLEQMMYLHFQVQPPPPGRLNPRLSQDVDRVLLVALGKKPEERFASVSAFARALQQALLDRSANEASTIMSAPNTNNVATVMSTPRLQESNEVRATLAISPIEALNGTHRTLTLPGGQHITVNVPAGAYDGQILREEGLSQLATINGSRSVLLLTLIVSQPREQSRQESNTHLAQTIAQSQPRLDVQNIAQSQSQSRPDAQTVAQSRPNLGAQTTPPSRPNVDGANTRGQGLPRSTIVLLVALAFLIGVVGTGFLYIYSTRTNPTTTNQPTTGNAASVTQTNATATVQAQLTAAAQNNTNTSAQNNANATAQANTNATATAQANTSTSQNPYTHSGTLVLDDPLADNSKGHNWQTGTNSRNATCEFRGGAFHATQPAQGFFHSCTAYNTDFSNFAFEVQMTTISGDYSGIIFCKQTDNTYYFFRLGNDGKYTLYRNVDANIDDALTLASGSVTVNQTNIVAAVVHNGTIDVYVNRLPVIKGVSDSTYTHGQIAILTGNDTNAAETVFSNAKVWTM